jgi:hypothetical protein
VFSVCPAERNSMDLLPSPDQLTIAETAADILLK